MNQKELLILGEKNLKQYEIEEPNIKAKKLLEFILKQTPEQFVINSLEEVSIDLQKQYSLKLQEIINGKPLQYITNTQEFMGLKFFVDEKVLIPQPDTETLVETAINIINNKNANDDIQILDLCTGSGCIGISIAKYIKNAQITLTDVSKLAIEVAKKNATLNNIQNVQFICSDLFKNIPNMQFNYIVSNPPYIQTSKINKLSKEVQKEPKVALDGGEDGLKFYKEILQNAYNYLKPQGFLLLEIGYDQAEKVMNLYNKNNLTLETKSAIKDLGGNDRVLVFKKK